MFMDLLGTAAAPGAGSALSAVSGALAGGPSSADSGSGNFNFGNFSTGDSIKGKSKEQVLSDTIVKVGAVLGAGLTIYTVSKMVIK